MNDAEKQEGGNALAVIGLGLLLADLLVVFFAPAAFRLGRATGLTALIVALAAVGVALILVGRRRRGRAPS